MEIYLLQTVNDTHFAYIFLINLNTQGVPVKCFILSVCQWIWMWDNICQNEGQEFSAETSANMKKKVQFLSRLTTQSRF